ncbi:1-aminocyclopropane-1-carboxylate deaminase/D-cysteine desulfhydrase [Bizionia argentinensis JUB59]|uniref:1-aminocyclopropane-1-carboxylate deaminase/D-cysteine desulfhydrase n=1 Tax=Bizionia argentinensis JUB59 TaxID=1046627 RepID=G2EA86_9FLAO|nr:pyridoxal-phosphate dependent enzyme [Bizionia argentinensis]EGV44696.1 1-aminocyclopropane-1-carboxylate deaminase/D-cysteine desulfhydrase [Bizionia argentinensis JUB59]
MFKFSENANVQLNDYLSVKPEYLIDPFISGNKYRKLNYNVLDAKKRGYQTLLTFGGAYSNHIAAVAAAGKRFGFQTLGVIRGEELATKTQGNPTLEYAKSQGMQFHYVTREAYRTKDTTLFIEELNQQFGDFYTIPEGGTNELAIKGCEEILTKQDEKFDFIVCSVGTGGTISGIINSAKSHQKILGFPALKGDFLRKDISKFARNENWDLITDYHFGGYAKINSELISFINDFKSQFHIPLDPIYTGKMAFGVFDLIKKGYFPKDAKILMIHTGGLQGIAGMNQLLEKKNMVKIQ